MKYVVVVALAVACRAPSVAPLATVDAGRTPTPAPSSASSASCGDGATACVLQCGAAEDWTPRATCSDGAWTCPAPRTPALRCAPDAYAPIGFGSCGPRVGGPCATDGGVRAPTCDDRTRLWTCEAATVDPGCDARFPRHVRAPDIAHVPDRPSFEAGVVSANEAAQKNLRCYACGPHRGFNVREWCCK